MEQADGISLENLVRLGTPMMHPNQLLDILHHKLNKTQVVLAAIFDLLTSQCDRHAQVGVQLRKQASPHSVLVLAFLMLVQPSHLSREPVHEYHA